MMPRCAACGNILWPSRPICPRCLSTQLEWTELSGRGTVYAFSIMHDTFMRGFEPPYVAADVELEEQPDVHLQCNIVDSSVGDVYIGMPVEVTFEDRTDEVTVPQFRPRRG